MAHHVCGMFVVGALSPDVLDRYDLRPMLRHGDLTFLPIDRHYATYWGNRLGIHGDLERPREFPSDFPQHRVLSVMVRELTDVDAAPFVVAMTEYFGGSGEQWALLRQNDTILATGEINGMLAAVGVKREPGKDEFDTVGLGAYRFNPGYLAQYAGLCEAQGL